MWCSLFLCNNFVFLFFLGYMYIIWLIRLIWRYKPFHTYLWYFTLKHFCNVCMLILATPPKDNWSLPNWQRSWRPRVQQNFIEHQYQVDIHDQFYQACIVWILHLFMNMSLDAPTTTFAKSNFYLLVNVKTLLGLNAIMPLLEVVYSWSKFPTMWCVCVWFHSIIVNFFERDEYKIYCVSQP